MSEREALPDLAPNGTLGKYLRAEQLRAIADEIGRLRRASQDADSRETGLDVETRSLIRELAETVHQTGSLRDHSDPNDLTGWNVHGIETCEDPLCVDALAALRSPDSETAVLQPITDDELSRLDGGAHWSQFPDTETAGEAG